MEYNLSEIFLKKEYLLTERRKSTNQSIWYHGTTSKFLREILKKGMVPDPKKKKWDTDEDTSQYVSSRVSLEGSYWTRNLTTAISSASSSTNKFGGYDIIVCAQLNPKSAIQDEDSIRFTLESFMSSTIQRGMNINPDAISHIYLGFLNNPDIYKKILDDFIKVAHNHLSQKNSKAPVYEKELKLYFDSELMRKLWYDFQSYNNVIFDNYQYLPGKEIKEGESWAEYKERVKNEVFDGNLNKDYWEQKLLHALDIIGKKYKRINMEKFNPTLRMIEPITFQGKNRIISIFGLPYHHDENVDIDMQYKYITLIYGEILDDFIKKYHESMTSSPIAFYDMNGNLIYEETK